MNRKRIIGLLLVILALLLPAPVPVHSAPAPQQTLLLFDSLAKGTPREGNITELQRLLAAYSTKVTLMSLDEYEQGTLASYSSVITVINSEDLAITNKAYLEDADNYRGEVLHVGYNIPVKMKQSLQLSTAVFRGQYASLSIGEFSGVSLNVPDMPYIAASKATHAYGSFSFQGGSLQAPYAVSRGQYTYVPYLEKGNFSTVAMAYVLKDWLPSSAAPQTYLVLKEIYPFSDFELLEKTADRLYQNGIPFIASVRPVFGNTGFPAMKRYLEALRIVQSRNGSIVVNAPAVRPPISLSDRSLKGKMNGFINVLVAGGIAPLGIGAEGYWIYDKEYAGAGMGFFDSAVLYPDEEARYMEQTDTSAVFASSLYSVTPEFLQGLRHTGKAMPQLPLDTAVVVDLPEDEEGLESMLRWVEQSWISFADYKQGAHKVVTDTNTIASADGVIRMGGKALNVGYAPEVVDSDYQYQKEQVKSFTRLFSAQNQFFIVVIIISLLVFGSLLIIGYRMYRRKYLK
ncbi:hypothetical protein NST99_32060 [Paenibacillus sp. FSL L8-0470]|uniref:hypothetical protein n=1 Tax=Paenibacillus sp. FSL L8-0470 TaxID=2954688 RepID=UPI0030F66DBE